MQRIKFKFPFLLLCTILVSNGKIYMYCCLRLREIWLISVKMKENLLFPTVELPLSLDLWFYSCDESKKKEGKLVVEGGEQWKRFSEELEKSFLPPNPSTKLLFFLLSVEKWIGQSALHPQREREGRAKNWSPRDSRRKISPSLFFSCPPRFHQRFCSLLFDTLGRWGSNRNAVCVRSKHRNICRQPCGGGRLARAHTRADALAESLSLRFDWSSAKDVPDFSSLLSQKFQKLAKASRMRQKKTWIFVRERFSALRYRRREKL